MSIDKLQGEKVEVRLWTPIAEVEYEALTQLKNIAALPWVFKHVAVMPDVHFGKGATVGSVIAMKGAVSPAAVGVDIGCGMGAIKTNLKASDLPDSLAAIRSQIERDIPVGFNQHDDAIKRSKFDVGGDRLMNDINALFARFSGLDARVQDLEGKARKQCGTLGGGNHFIELCLDTEGNVWMMLHSGSRNIGKTLAEVHMGIAKRLTHNATLPDPDLAVFLSGTPEMETYRRELFWAQEYAFLNRRVMFELYKNVIRKFFPQVTFGDPILCHHNYVSEETHFGENLIVTRKGAIRAGLGDMGIIPGSMGARSFIVKGKGNEESFCSASHGAGRKMSRGKAKRTFSLQDLADQTKGVECRKDADVLDEIPGAYKDIEQVMRNQADLVEIVAELKQVLCVKG
jgi:tRNA-splicing ligase RtcB